MNKDQQPPVVFLDSGVGGLPYLFTFAERNPQIPRVYVADTANFPYGTKSEKDLLTILFELVDRIIEYYSPTILVIACNTASVVGLGYLRSSFPHIDFVGTVPAIKPAAIGSRTRAIGILATTRTLTDPYIFQLLQEFGADCILHSQAIDELVKIVEDGQFLNPEEIAEVSRIVAPARAAFFGARVDQVVLGCTHFLHVTEVLREIFGTGVTLVDSRDGVAKRVETLLGSVRSQNSMSEEHLSPSKLVLTGTSPTSSVYKKFIDQGLLVKNAWGAN